MVQAEVLRKISDDAKLQQSRALLEEISAQALSSAMMGEYKLWFIVDIDKYDPSVVAMIMATLQVMLYKVKLHKDEDCQELEISWSKP